MSRILRHILHIPCYRINPYPLFVHNMRDVPEKLVQFPNGLLDIPYFAFSLHDQRFLKVDLIL